MEIRFKKARRRLRMRRRRAKVLTTRLLPKTRNLTRNEGEEVGGRAKDEEEDRPGKWVPKKKKVRDSPRNKMVDATGKFMHIEILPWWGLGAESPPKNDRR